MGDTFTIAINAENLTRLQGEYGDLIKAIESRLGAFQWDAKSNMYLSGPFPLWVGGAGFTQAQALAAKLEQVRADLVQRLTSTKENSSNLYVGLQRLLADTTAVEELNTMTAEDFNSFIPVSTGLAGS